MNLIRISDTLPGKRAFSEKYVGLLNFMCARQQNHTIPIIYNAAHINLLYLIRNLENFDFCGDAEGFVRRPIFVNL